jgi:hypothetical protein
LKGLFHESEQVICGYWLTIWFSQLK